MNCQVCGALLPPDAAACRSCGAPAGSAQPAGHPRPGCEAPPEDLAQPGSGTRPQGRAQQATWAPPPAAGPPAGYALGPLATAVTVMLALGAAASLVSLAAEVLEVLVILLYLPLIPVFIVWFYQARKNAEGRGWRQRWRPGWAIGAWFVPVIWFWVPYQIMADIWRAGLPAGQRGRPAWLPIAWWICWLLAWFTGFRVVSSTTSTFHGVTAGFYLGETALSKVFEAAAAVTLILVVRAVTSEGVGRPRWPGEAPVAPAA